MHILYFYISISLLQLALWWLDSRQTACCRLVENRLREQGVAFEVPPKMDRVFDYPALLIRLSEEHLAYDREGWLLASKLKEFHSLIVAGTIAIFPLFGLMMILFPSMVLR